MSNVLNLNDVTRQIQHYVRLIKNQRNVARPSDSFLDELPVVSLYNDLRSNINPLNGTSKFSLHSMSNNDSFASSLYASEAYSHLESLQDKNKVVIDFMHKNNRNFDVQV